MANDLGDARWPEEIVRIQKNDEIATAPLVAGVQGRTLSAIGLEGGYNGRSIRFDDRCGIICTTIIRNYDSYIAISLGKGTLNAGSNILPVIKVIDNNGNLQIHKARSTGSGWGKYIAGHLQLLQEWYQTVYCAAQEPRILRASIASAGREDCRRIMA